ncbi:MAG: DUF5668 domain-containing protein [Firmicutes bacterium]|nr:DUF5668 domain-containing protein [Bacillota bacterium]
MNFFGGFLGILIALFLIVFGVLLLLSNLGIIAISPGEIFSITWPLILILLGLYIIWRHIYPMSRPGAVSLSESLGGAAKADITLNFGAGELTIGPLISEDKLLEGKFLVKPDKTVRKLGYTLEVKLQRTQWVYRPFMFRAGDNWQVNLSTKTPLVLRVNAGAARALIDLTENLVELVELSTGASDVTLHLPKASGFTRVVIKGGATDVKVEIPAGVAARISSTQALSSLNIDEERFPGSGTMHVSPDYETAKNRVDIEISTGVSSITVR